MRHTASSTVRGPNAKSVTRHSQWKSRSTSGGGGRVSFPASSGLELGPAFSRFESVLPGVIRSAAVGGLGNIHDPKSRKGLPSDAALIKSSQMGAANLPPVPLEILRRSSYATNTPATKSGVKPTNQRLRPLDVVPVFPAAGRLSDRIRRAVPRKTTSRINRIMVLAVSKENTWADSAHLGLTSLHRDSRHNFVSSTTFPSP